MKPYLSYLIAALVGLGSLNAVADGPNGVLTGDEVLGQIQSAFQVAAGPGVSAGEIDLDAQAVRYLLQPFADKMGASFELFLNEVQHVKLKNQGAYSELTIDMTHEVSIQIKDEATAKEYELYQVYFPQQSRFKIKANDGKISLSPQTELVFRVKLPGISDNVYFHGIELDLGTGKAEITAGIIGDIVLVSAKADLFQKKFDGVDYDRTISQNFAIWMTVPMFFSFLP